MFVEERRRHLESNGIPLPVSELELVARRMGRFRRQVDRERYLDGLRGAGLTE